MLSKKDVGVGTVDRLSEKNSICFQEFGLSQPAIKCSKLTIETLEHGVKFVQS